MATRPSAEIGIVVRERSMLGTVHGLNDMFVIAERLARERTGASEPVLRTSFFGETPAGFARLGDPAARSEPTVLIVPPLDDLGLSMADDPRLSGWLRERHAAGVVLASTCGGVFMFGHAGLLDGRRVTTHWACAEQLASAFPSAEVDADELVIDDGDLITAGGMMAWSSLGLSIIGHLLGPVAMAETARFMVIDPAGREQRYYRIFTPRLDHGDAAVSLAQARLHGQGPSGVSIGDMAGWARLEMRTFVRRFAKATGLRPNEYCQRLRVDMARALLEESTTQISRIALDVGYLDAASFRKVFTRMIGLSPVDYRKRFSRNAEGDRRSG